MKTLKDSLIVTPHEEADQPNLLRELRNARKKAEDVAQLYTDLYVEIYNFSPAGYFRLTETGKICELNLSGAKMLGKDRSTLINKPFSQFISEESRPDFETFFNNVYATFSQESCEVTVKKSDNTTAYLHLDGIVSEIEKKCLIAVIDISDRIQMEAKLRESEENFRILFEHSPIGMSKTGVDNSMMLNDALAKMFGYTKEEILARTWMDITHPEDIEKTQREIRTLMSGEVDHARFEKRFIHKDGHFVNTELSSFLQRDKSGKPQFLITAIREIF